MQAAPFPSAGLLVGPAEHDTCKVFDGAYSCVP